MISGPFLSFLSPALALVNGFLAGGAAAAVGFLEARLRMGEETL